MLVTTLVLVVSVTTKPISLKFRIKVAYALDKYTGYFS